MKAPAWRRARGSRHSLEQAKAQNILQTKKDGRPCRELNGAAY